MDKHDIADIVSLVSNAGSVVLTNYVEALLKRGSLKPRELMASIAPSVDRLVHIHRIANGDYLIEKLSNLAEIDPVKAKDLFDLILSYLD